MDSQPVRPISRNELRDGLEAVALAVISDEELAERGVPLDQHEVLRDGLGPSTYALIELETGEQYLLDRLDLMPEGRGVEIHAALTDQANLLADRLMLALGLPTERITWRVAPEDWAALREAYDDDARAAWLRRTGRDAS